MSLKTDQMHLTKIENNCFRKDRKDTVKGLKRPRLGKIFTKAGYIYIYIYLLKYFLTNIPKIF